MHLLCVVLIKLCSLYLQHFLMTTCLNRLLNIVNVFLSEKFLSIMYYLYITTTKKYYIIIKLIFFIYSGIFEINQHAFAF